MLHVTWSLRIVYVDLSMQEPHVAFRITSARPSNMHLLRVAPASGQKLTNSMVTIDVHPCFQNTMINTEPIYSQAHTTLLLKVDVLPKEDFLVHQVLGSTHN